MLRRELRLGAPRRQGRAALPPKTCPPSWTEKTLITAAPGALGGQHSGIISRHLLNLISRRRAEPAMAAEMIVLLSRLTPALRCLSSSSLEPTCYVYSQRRVLIESSQRGLGVHPSPCVERTITLIYCSAQKSELSLLW